MPEFLEWLLDTILIVAVGVFGLVITLLTVGVIIVVFQELIP